MTVFFLTVGDGSDGNEWDVISIHSTYKEAEKNKNEYESPQLRKDGSTYILKAQIEEWEVDIKKEKENVSNF